MSSDACSDGAAALLRWYDRHRRELPWRESHDPYRVWVSEVMLQQTRVDAALPYYRRFVRRFPSLESLAAADIDEVLALWSGLGYYRRARDLHRAARRLAAADGGWPRTAAAWRELPGVGDYTAAAVASIAFGENVPAVDGNVLRVTARLLAEPGRPHRAAVRRRLTAAAAELLDPRRPGDGNQALMELGATVCTPRRPDCPRCPLAGTCRAAAAGDPERYPPPRPRRPPRRQRLLAFVVFERDRLLLFRRPDDHALLAGTWELPWTRRRGGRAAVRDLERRYGGVWTLGPRLGEVRHGITHRALVVTVRSARRVPAGDAPRAGRPSENPGTGAAGEVREGAEAAWVELSRLPELPLSSLVRKVLDAAGPLKPLRR